MVSNESDRPARVWILQSNIQHYRLPVFDGLVEAGRGVYELTVLGPTADGAAHGGGRRDYIRDIPRVSTRKFGVGCHEFSTALKLLRDERPGCVIMGMNPRDLTSWRLPVVARSLGIPAVGWSKVHSFSGLPGPMVRAVKRRFFRRVDFMICYGRSSLEELVSLGYPPERAVIAQNTIDTSRIFERGEEIATRGAELRRRAGLESARVILCVGRMDPEKRQRDLLEAWPRIVERVPGAALVLVGGGPDLEEIRREAAVVDGSVDGARILVTGRVPEGDDYAWIAASDLTVYPGAVGLAINQSMAFGKPVVIADEWGADAEIVRDGETGWRYPRGDLGALVSTIGGVFEHDAERAAVTARTRGVMRDEVTIQNMVSKIDGVIRRALGEHVMRTEDRGRVTR